jgi:hypothetical protein
VSWRFEPTPRSVGIEEGLAARVHDALWFLARQWQLGEFQGKDAGTPAIVQVAGNTTAITSWRGAQQTAWSDFDPGENPLDSLVEPEDESTPDYRERVEAGAYFQRQLAAAGLEKYQQAFAVAHVFDAGVFADPAFAADPLLAAVARRSPDGLSLEATARALAAGQSSPVTIDPGDLAAVAAIAGVWLTWYGAEIAASPGSGTAVTWQPNRLEYGFALSSQAAGGTVLTADAYLGDGLDWFDFDIDPSQTAAAGAASAAVTRQAVPTTIRYGGMPLPRFWAMEDARSDLGSIDAAPNDIGRLLLIEFATVYGNDWYVLPMKLPVGSLTILDSVVVSDVFGRNLLIERAGLNEPQWNLFSLDTKGLAHLAQGALFLPPTAGYTVDSDAVESVLFLRDDVADLAWAVESRIEDGLERKVDRRAAWVGSRTVAPGNPALPSYRVETIVPDYWIPFAPEQLADQQSIHLRLVPLEVDDGAIPRIVEPQSRLLSTNGSDGRLWVYNEEIPREGTSVQRVHRYARWLGGRAAIWTARSRQPGGGEGSSGLRFDVLDPG